jgi:uncharacterized RDD family membrane protein YckC
MGTVDWDHYQVPLTPGPTPAAAGAARPASRVVAKLLATRGARLVAWLLDVLIAALVVVMAGELTARAFPQYAAAKAVGLVSGAVALTVIQATLLSWLGQTLGKMAVGVRVVRLADESNPGLLYAFVLREVVPGLISLIPIIGQMFALIDRVCIFSEDRRCLRDYMADTKVIEA